MRPEILLQEKRNKKKLLISYMKDNKLYPDDNYMLVELINYYLMGDTPAKVWKNSWMLPLNKSRIKFEYYRAKGSFI